MNKPKIAVMMDWFLPGTKAGGPVRSAYSLLGLLKDDFDFYVITTNKDLGSDRPYGEIKADLLFCRDNIHYYYFSEGNLNTKNMLGILSRINPDLVYLNSFWSFNFSINIVKLKNRDLIKSPMLLAPRGMLGKGALSVKPLKKKLFLFLAKNLKWYHRITFQATQKQEESDIRSKFATAKIEIAPNVNASPAVRNKSVKESGTLKLFFLSRVLPIKNLHFALEILNSIPSEYKVEYDIFGNIEDRTYWQDCEKLINNLPKNIIVRHKGELQFNKVQQTICNYQFLFLPTLNENFGHSIVESLLCGCPAIISDQTPWNDLETNNAGYAINLNNKQRFIDVIIGSAKLDQDAFFQKSNAAATYIQRKVDLDSSRKQYMALFDSVIKNGK